MSLKWTHPWIWTVVTSLFSRWRRAAVSVPDELLCLVRSLMHPSLQVRVVTPTACQPVPTGLLGCLRSCEYDGVTSMEVFWKVQLTQWPQNLAPAFITGAVFPNPDGTEHLPSHNMQIWSFYLKKIVPLLRLQLNCHGCQRGLDLSFMCAGQGWDCMGR